MDTPIISNLPALWHLPMGGQVRHPPCVGDVSLAVTAISGQGRIQEKNFGVNINLVFFLGKYIDYAVRFQLL